MRPGSGDIKVSVLISGDELVELKRYTYAMVEAYGLDARIERYSGKRPIGLYRWDFKHAWMLRTSKFINKMLFVES